jgi:hypothetical protein
MRKSKRLLIEKVLLGANLVGIAIGLVLTILGSSGPSGSGYIGGAVVVLCTVGAIVCIRNIRRIKKEVTG